MQRRNMQSALQQLALSVPPMLAQAIGYFGEANLVAFFFDVGDEAYYADGQICTCGEWDTYDLFLNHPLVAPHVLGYHFGSSEEPPAHYLLLDREACTLAVAPVALAHQLLREQWGAVAQSEPLVINEEKWEELAQNLLAQLHRPTPAQLMEYWQEHQRLVEQLKEWLAQAWEGTL